VAGFPLLTDNHVRDSIIQALRRAGWDVVRAVDLFGERHDGGGAARLDRRVLATCEEGLHRIGSPLAGPRVAFPDGLLALERHREMSDGDMVEAFQATVDKPNAFSFPIEHIKLKR
jgi:hypothetical protein